MQRDVEVEEGNNVLASLLLMLEPTTDSEIWQGSSEQFPCMGDCVAVWSGILLWSVASDMYFTEEDSAVKAAGDVAGENQAT